MKASCFEAMSDKKMKTKVTFTNKVFYRNGLSGQQHL